MEGAREIQIYVKHQTYVFFYCFSSCLKFKLCFKYVGKFKWTNRSSAKELPLVKLKHSRITVSIFQLKIDSCTNTYDTVEKNEGKSA